MGNYDESYELRRGNRGSIGMPTSIALEGIPVMTAIPISYRMQVCNEKRTVRNKEILAESDPAEGYWYEKKEATLECWLPEKRARHIAREEKRKAETKNSLQE